MVHSIISDELKILKKTVKSFIKDHVLPAEQKEGSTVEALPVNTLISLQSKAKDAGLWLLGSNKDWGGAGLSMFEQAILLEEAVQHRLGLNYPGGGAFGQDFPGFLEKCSDEQIKTYIEPAARSGNGCFIAIWEPQESNDLQNLKCRAERQGNQWILHGTKSYATHAAKADFGVVLVNCLTESGEEKPTLFLIDRNDPVSQKEKKLIDVLPCHELDLSNIAVSDQRRIGEIGAGLQLIEEWITESQIRLAARCIGIAQKALEISLNYASLRVTRGKPLAEFPTIRSMLSSSAAELQAARLLVRDAAWKWDTQAKDHRAAAQMAKYMATETASKIVDKGIQIHGGAGFTRDVPFERWFKELRISRLDLCSTETLHEQIADFLFI